MITEVLTAGTAEFVELYDPNEKEFPLKDLYLAYFSSNREWHEPYLNKSFPTAAIVPSGSYFLIGFGDSMIRNLTLPI